MTAAKAPVALCIAPEDCAAGVLSTLGALVTAALTALAAVLALHLGWIEGLLLGAVVASTDEPDAEAAALTYRQRLRRLARRAWTKLRG